MHSHGPRLGTCSCRPDGVRPSHTSHTRAPHFPPSPPLDFRLDASGANTMTNRKDTRLQLSGRSLESGPLSGAPRAFRSVQEVQSRRLHGRTLGRADPLPCPPGGAARASVSSAENNGDPLALEKRSDGKEEERGLTPGSGPSASSEDGTVIPPAPRQPRQQAPQLSHRCKR